MAGSFEFDSPDFDAAGYWKSRKAQAAEDDAQESAKLAFIKNGSGYQAGSPALGGWLMNLPKNITVGLIDAVNNTLDAAGDFANQMNAGEEMHQRAKEGKPAEKTPQERREASLAANATPVPPTGAVDQFYGKASDAVVRFRDELAQGGNAADALTQTLAQFALPFKGWTKLVGVFGQAKKASFLSKVVKAGAAEAGTVATAFDPQGPRVADLLQMGKSVEGKFGDAMNQIAPDGSLFNSYIDYMTDRRGESEAEGRFKNVVDSLGASAAVTGLLKTGAATIRGIRRLPEFAVAEKADDPAELAKFFVRQNAGNEAAAYSEMQRLASTASPENAGALKQASQVLREGGASEPQRYRRRRVGDQPAKFDVVPGENGFAVHVDGQPTLAFRTFDEASKEIKALGGTPPARPSAETIDRVEAGLKSAPDAIDKLPLGELNVVPDREGFTLRAGERPMLTFAKEEDAQAAIADFHNAFGTAALERMESGRAKLTDKNFDTLHSFSRVLQGNMDRPVSTHSLVEALERNLKGDTEQGAFYKELLGRLRDKKLGGMTTVTAEAPSPTVHGRYFGDSNAIKIHPGAFESPGKLLHVFSHEAVHAATMRGMRENPTAYRKIDALRKAAEKSLYDAQEAANGAVKVQYGFKNADEFVAEIESNPEFRAAMKKGRASDGETVWDKYLKAIAGILGLGAIATSPEFSKLMDPKQEEQQGA